MNASHHSPPADADALLIHAPFLRALARSLLGSGHPDEPEDVVQEAYLRAAERPPRDADAARGWLATVVKRVVFERGRRAPRQRHWEQMAAQRHAVPSTEDIVERESVRRRVVDAVVALDEPYRSAILLRFYDDLPPRSIAKALDVPVETVRTRIKRGLAKLERSLDEAHGGDRRAWSAALAPLAFPRTAHAAWSWAFPITPKAVLAGVVALTLAFTAWQVLTPSSSTNTPEDALTTASLTPAPGIQAPAVEIDDQLDAQPLTSPAPRFAFDVIDAVTARPVPGVAVALSGLALDELGTLLTLPARTIGAHLTARSALSDDAGRVEFLGIPQGVWAISTAGTPARPQALHGIVVAHDPDVVVQPAVLAVSTLVAQLKIDDLDVHAAALDAGFALTLPISSGGITHTGTVLDTDGNTLADIDVAPIPAALDRFAGRVGLAPVLAAFGPTLGRATTDATGRFLVDADASTTSVHVSSPDHVPQLVALDTAARDTTIVLERRVAFSLTGIVRDADGKPAANALVTLDAVAAPMNGHDAFAERAARQGKTRTTTDVLGRFTFDDIRHLASGPHGPTEYLEEGRTAIHVGASIPGHLPTYSRATIHREGFVDAVEIALKRGGPLRGHIAWAGGSPAGRMQLRSVGPDGRANTQTLDASDFELWRAAHGNWTFLASVDGQQSDPIDIDWRGQHVELRPVFSTATWTVDVTVLGAGDVGTPEERSANVAPQLWVYATHVEPGDHPTQNSWAAEQRDDAWHLTLGHGWAADDAWVVAACDGEVLASTHVTRDDTQATLDIMGRGAGTRLGGLVIDVAPLMPPGTMTTPHSSIHVAGESAPLGHLMSSRIYSTTKESDNAIARMLGLGGTEGLEAELHTRLPPGRYDITLRPIFAGIGASVIRDITVEAGRVTQIAAPALDATQVTVELADDVRSSSVTFALFDSEGRRWLQHARDDKVLDTFLPAGGYEVTAMTTTGRFGRTAFAVGAGTIERVEVDLEPAALTGISVRGVVPPGTPLHLTVVDELGRLILDRHARSQGAEPVIAPIEASLPTGVYDVVLTSAGEVLAQQRLVSGGSTPIEATLDLAPVR